METTRAMARTMSVKKMRDFSSGILKQFRNVLMIFSIMRGASLLRRRCGRLCFDDFACAALGFDLGPGGGAERVGRDGEFPGQFTIPKNLDAFDGAIGEAGLADGGDIDAGAIVELVQRFQ